MEIKIGRKNKGMVGVKEIDWIFNLSSKEKGLSETQSPSKLATEGFKSVVYACITLIANTIAQNEYKLLKNGKKIEDKKDYIVKLLKKPNPLMDWYDFIYLLDVMMELHGERYIYVARDRLGRPAQLWVVPSHAIEPVFDEKENTKIIKYKYDLGNGKEIEFSPDEIVYDFIPSPVKINRGDSPLSKILTEYDIHIFSKIYAKNFYRNGAVPQGILSTDQRLNAKEVEMLEKAWKAKHQGVRKSWEIAILFGGLKYQELSVRPDSRDFIEQSKWTRDDILSIFKVPPFKLGVTDGINRSNAHEQNVIFARDCIKPRLTKLQSMFNNKLFPLLKADEYEIEFTNPVPEDEELNVQKAKVGGLYGVLTFNEIRQLLGFEPLEGEEGDELVPPLNLPQGRQPKKDYEKILDEIYQIDKAINKMKGE